MFDIDEELPTEILGELCWVFDGQPYSNRGEFEAAVAQYGNDIEEGTGVANPWLPEQVVFPEPSIRIQHIRWEGDSWGEREFTLQADNGRYFSAGELLHKIHNAVVDSISQQDHRFFEGLQYHEDQQGAGSPALYWMSLGS